MEDYQRSIRVGAAAIACALVFRVGLSGLPGKMLTWLTDAERAASPIESETSRDVRQEPTREVFLSFPPESSPPWVLPEPEPEEPTLPRYTEAVQVLNSAGAEADFSALLEQPLTWNLRDGEPAVLILHTHTSESYTPRGEDYQEVSGWHTLDEGYNMLSIGDAVAQVLEEAGIRVVQDRTVHDYPSYNGSYDHARESMKALLEEYPTIRMVLDLHRDAAEAPSGGQYRTLANLAGQAVAQLMPVMGSGFEGFRENLSLALKLMAQLERQAPGITRPLVLRRASFNQDLCPGALLFEVGSAGNSHDEAILAARELAKAILALANGTGEGEESGE